MVSKKGGVRGKILSLSSSARTSAMHVLWMIAQSSSNTANSSENEEGIVCCPHPASLSQDASPSWLFCASCSPAKPFGGTHSEPQKHSEAL